VAARALEFASRADQQVRRAYQAGLGTSLELVTAAAALRQQQLTVALRDYDVLRARVAALLALAECAP
jgi:outer membrane protein TolC